MSPAIASVSTLPERRSVALPWLLIGGYTSAVLDLAAAMAYWAPHGVPLSRIPQSIASWLLGPSAFSGGLLTAVLGTLLYGQLLWGVMSLYHAAARRYRVLLRRPVVCGSLYGVAAYAAIFELMVPLLFGVHPAADPLWKITCVLAYALLIGVPCALFARVAQGAARRPLVRAAGCPAAGGGSGFEAGGGTAAEALRSIPSNGTVSSSPDASGLPRNVVPASFDRRTGRNGLDRGAPNGRFQETWRELGSRVKPARLRIVLASRPR